MTEGNTESEELEHKLNTLYSCLGKIGIRAGTSNPNYQHWGDKHDLDIEDFLTESLNYFDCDGRISGLIFSWFMIHHKMINPDKFFKTFDKKKQKTPWFYGACAFLTYELNDKRFKKGAIRLNTPHHIRDDNQDGLIKMKGAFECLDRVNIKAAKSAIRLRSNDIFTIKELAHWNRQYRNRLLMGPIYRADIFTKMENGEKSPEAMAESLDLPLSDVTDIMSDLNAYLNPNPPYID